MLRLHGARTRWAYGILEDFARSAGSRALSDAPRPSHPVSNRVRWLTRRQAEALVGASRSDPKLALIVILGIGQGLRRVEWQRLRVGDIDVPNRRMLVRGKGRGSPKLVWMPLHPAFPPIWARYLRYRARLTAGRPTGPGGELTTALVHFRRGKLEGYSLSGLDAMIRRIGTRIGKEFPELRLSSHMLRRSGATLLEEAMLASPRRNPDGTYRVLQVFLRHENLATTMKYLQENPGRQRRAMEQFDDLLPWRSR